MTLRFVTLTVTFDLHYSKLCHNFWTIKDKTFVFHVYIPCDKAFQIFKNFDLDTSNKDRHLGLWLTETFLIFLLQPLDRFWQNLTGRKSSTSLAKLLLFEAIIQRRWQPWPRNSGDIPTSLQPLMGIWRLTVTPSRNRLYDYLTDKCLPIRINLILK